VEGIDFDSAIIGFVQEFSFWEFLWSWSLLKTYQCLLFGCHWRFWKFLQVFIPLSLVKIHSRIYIEVIFFLNSNGFMNRSMCCLMQCIWGWVIRCYPCDQNLHWRHSYCWSSLYW